MRNLHPAPVAALALLTVAAPAAAQDESLQMGRDIAETYCVACHDIAADGAMGLDPTGFAEIAATYPADEIRARIVTPVHEAMPRYTEYMIGGNIDDMVAYILSLKE